MNIRTHNTALNRTLLAVAAASALATGSVHAQQIDVNAWKQSNEYRAMKLQRELSKDMRQDQSLLLSSHNSFNSSAYGPSIYPFNQHSYTLSQQLDLGLRSLDIDVHHLPGYPNELFVTHALCSGGGYTPGEMTLGDALGEIYSWLAANPDEVVILNIEQHFPQLYPTTQHSRMQAYFELAFGGGLPLGDILIRPSELEPLTEVDLDDNGSDWTQRIGRFVSLSLSDLRARGRVLVVNIGGAQAPCNQPGHYWPDYPAQNFMFGDAPDLGWCGSRNWDFIRAADFANDPTLRYWGSNAIGRQHRDCDEDLTNSNQFISNYSFFYNNTSTGEYQDYGSESPQVTREAVRAGMDVIRFDPVGKSLARAGYVIEFPADEQMRSTIWSWDHRYLPPNDGQSRAAMAVIEGDTARIRWENPNADMRYATQTWVGEWSISDAHGSFFAAPAEEPESTTSRNFRAPGNGFEMQNLFGHMVRTGITKVWINYQDLNGSGTWAARTQNRKFGTYVSAPITSPVPALVTSRASVDLALTLPSSVHGNVMCAYPGPYIASPTSPIRLNQPMTIVPAAHGLPVAIGRP